MARLDNSTAVVPNDLTPLTVPTEALYVGGAGNLVLLLGGDSAPTTFVGVTAGTLLPFRVKQVLATGTTATNIVAIH